MMLLYFGIVALTWPIFAYLIVNYSSDFKGDATSSAMAGLMAAIFWPVALPGVGMILWLNKVHARKEYRQKETNARMHKGQGIEV